MVLLDELMAEKNRLRAIEEACRKGLEGSPEGLLRIQCCGGMPQYYLREKRDDPIGRYLKKDEEDLAARLAQKSYEEKVLKEAEAELKAIDHLLQALSIGLSGGRRRRKLWNAANASGGEGGTGWADGISPGANDRSKAKNTNGSCAKRGRGQGSEGEAGGQGRGSCNDASIEDYGVRSKERSLAKCSADMIGRKIPGEFQITESPIQRIYAEMNPMRRELVTPYDVPDDEYARQWQAETYTTNEHYGFGVTQNHTQRGERVRSKSEILIADRLYAAGVPYHYEKPLHLGDGRTYYPDFTVLNARTRKELYWEHFGLMDDGEYRENSLKKYNKYVLGGLVPGVSFIATYETGGVPLDTRVVDRIIEELLL